LISFLGALPLGTLNISATQIVVQESTGAAVYFAVGCLLTEMIYIWPQEQVEKKNVVLNNNMSRFWIEYYLISKKILEARNDHYNIYTAAIGPGTLLGWFHFYFRR